MLALTRATNIAGIMYSIQTLLFYQRCLNASSILWAKVESLGQINWKRDVDAPAMQRSPMHRRTSVRLFLDGSRVIMTDGLRKWEIRD